MIAQSRSGYWIITARTRMVFFFQAEDGIRDATVTGVQTCALPICSSDLYQWARRPPQSSINFVTCHDGFTLNDLVSYNGKHNEANGEGNRDGSNDNLSWNCGVEGASDDAAVEALRERQIRNFAVILLVSQGVPMIVAGDEARRTQQGNNNAWNQANEVSWLDWDRMTATEPLRRFWRL